MQENSATTYAVVGALNKVPILILGAVLFDAIITAQQWAYILASTMGGFLYSYCQFMLQAMKKPLLPNSHPDEASKQSKS